MQKSFTPKNFQNSPANQQEKRAANQYQPSKKTVSFILAYAAALSVFKTKMGITNVLLN